MNNIRPPSSGRLPAHRPLWTPPITAHERIFWVILSGLLALSTVLCLITFERPAKTIEKEVTHVLTIPERADEHHASCPTCEYFGCDSSGDGEGK